MKPTEYYNKPIIGTLITRPIKELNLRDSELEQYKTASIREEAEYEVIDIYEHSKDENIFVINEWENESLFVVKFIHNNFVKDYRRV